MIKDDRITFEIVSAMGSLNAIRYVYDRDGMVSSKYLLEKVRYAKHVCEWLEDIAKEDKEV